MSNIENLEGEIWRDIENYPAYQVSNLGRVKRVACTIACSDGRIRKNKEHIIQPCNNGRGWLYVSLRNDSSGTSCHKHKVHRLVASSFIPNPNNKPFVDHINSIRHDNRVVNLRWCDAKENSNNPKTIERLIASKNTEEYKRKASEIQSREDVNKKRILSNPNTRPVLLYDNNKRLIKEFLTIAMAASHFGVSPAYIRNRCIGKCHLENGYTLEYKTR